ncbi:hypothetical protein MNB_SM-5-1475 [hydrothermal vent metagenome]|uniref:Uncharacterized protein n=1 Tax=hydrothermal vent metagenome TaxID=652676 RepID=A0A1W1CY78_9ZZZZ
MTTLYQFDKDHYRFGYVSLHIYHEYYDHKLNIDQLLER